MNRLQETAFEGDNGVVRSPGRGWRPQVHHIWDELLDQLLPLEGSGHTQKGSFPEFFRIVVDGKSSRSMSALSQFSLTPLQSLFFPCLRLMSESTGVLRFLRERFHASRPETSRCCLRRILCGLGSITYRMQIDTCIRFLNKSRVLSLRRLCQYVLTDNSRRRQTYFLL